MRNRLSLSVGLALTLVLITGIPAVAGTPGRPFHSIKADIFMRAQPFTLGGRFSGVLGGQIQIEGVTYRLAPDASVYEVGVGSMPLGTLLQDRYVSFSGLTMNNSTTIHSLVVRPASELTYGNDGDLSSHVHIMNASVPR